MSFEEDFPSLKGILYKSELLNKSYIKVVMTYLKKELGLE